MSTNNKQGKRSLPVPEEVIERAAGFNDSFSINGYWVKSACEKETEEPKKSNTQTLTEGVNRRVVEYSLGLPEGMTIPAKDGGIKVSKERKVERDNR